MTRPFRQRTAAATVAAEELGVKAMRGISWSVVQQVATYLIQFAVFIVLARLLEPRAFGLLALALVYVAFVQIFVDQGVGDAIIQLPHTDAEYLDTAFWSNLLTGAILCALGWAAAAPLAMMLGQPDLAALLRWLSILFPIHALAIVPQSLLRREMRFHSLALRSVVQHAGGGCVGVVLALRGFGVWSLVGQQMAAAAIGVVVLWMATPWRPGLRLSRVHSKHLLWFGGSIAGVNLLNLVSRQGDNLIVGYVLGPVMLGYYAIAYQILLTLSNVVVGTINSVTLPFFSRLQDDRVRLRSTLNRLTGVTATVATPCFLGVAVLAPEMVVVLFGERWTPSVPTLQVLCLIGTLYAGFYFHGPVLTAVGQPQWNLALNALQAVTNCAAFVIGVRWGIVGVAAAYVLRAYLTAPVHLVVLRRQIGLETRQYLRQFVPSVLAGAVMVAAVASARSAAATVVGPLAVLILCVPIGVATYGALIYWWQPALRDDAFAVVRRAVGRGTLGGFGRTGRTAEWRRSDLDRTARARGERLSR